MELNRGSKELFIVILSALVLAIAVSYKNNDILQAAALCFLIIIGANVLSKKALGYLYETDVEIKFWSWYQYGFRKDAHFKNPTPMAWLPLVLALFSKGYIWWLGILEFDVAPRTERVSRRHGLYRFTEVTEWHMGLIATIGIITNLVLAIIGYIAGFELFAKLSVYYAMWSILPLSSMDGTKIFFASKGLWATMAIIALIFLGWGLIII